MAQTEPMHAPAVRRLTGILETMNVPGSRLRSMLSADCDPPLVPPSVDARLADPELMTRGLAAGRYTAVRRSLLSAPPDSEAYEAWILGQVRALVEPARGPLCFSHSTAALLHGAWSYGTPRLVHVTHPANPHVRRRAEPDVRRHHTRLFGRDCSTVAGIRVTSKERTLVDCLRTLQPAAALVAADSLFRLGAVPAEVGRVMTASWGKRGMVQARRLLEVCDPRSASPGETVARLAAIDAGLPRPECQMVVSTRSGDRFVDLGWPEVGAGVEFDGEVKYSGGEFGLPADVLRRQQERHEDIVAAGVDLLRVGWADLSDPQQLGFDVREVYEAALRRSSREIRRRAA